jgi:hypothetical protein
VGGAPTQPYTVQPGDNPSSIARAHGITLGELFQANPFLMQDKKYRFNAEHQKDGDPDRPFFVMAGDTLDIPPPTFSLSQCVAPGTFLCGPSIETVCDYVKLVKKLEADHPGWRFDEVLSALRHTAIYDDPHWQAMYGTDKAPNLQAVPGGTLDDTDIGVMRAMSQHGGDSPLQETGIGLDSSGQLVAIGHVLTGMSAGMHNKSSIEPTVGWKEGAAKLVGVGEPMDNLYATTISGDLGQFASLILAGRSANVAAMDCTPAELVGDIDGFNLGMRIFGGEIPVAPPAKVSDVLGNYYGCSGEIDAGIKTRFRDFGNLVDMDTLQKQIVAFTTNYNYKVDKDSETRAWQMGDAAIERESRASLNRFRRWLSQQRTNEMMKGG